MLGTNRAGKYTLLALISGQRCIVLTSFQDVPNLVPGVTRSERHGDKHELFWPDADQLVRSLVRADIQFSGIEVRGATLEGALSN